MRAPPANSKDEPNVDVPWKHAAGECGRWKMGRWNGQSCLLLLPRVHSVIRTGKRELLSCSVLEKLKSEMLAKLEDPLNPIPFGPIPKGLASA